MAVTPPTSRVDDDYDRIAQAIAFIRQQQRSQPDLATIAQQIGLSESHFQRLFTQWAGISPKRFLQYLTLEYAKGQIQQTRSLLELAVDAGLSGPGRLHDLFITLAALSPGEFKTGGAGLHICYGIHPTPFGQALLATTTRGICHLSFVDGANQTTIEELGRSWPNAKIVCAPEVTQPLVEQIFAVVPGQPPRSLTVLVKGTNFQIQVWQALLAIPFGGLTTYQAIAHRIGRPGATRAVGNAVGNNAISYLIPCHRVLRESGELGGYRWGLERKAAMLGWEASCVAAETPK